MALPPRSAAPVLIALASVFGAGAAASLWLNLPGQFSPDSVWQLQQGRMGVYNGWHPPVTAWLLGLFDRISPGAPGFIAFDAALGFGGLLAFAALPRRPRPLAVVLAAMTCASPLLLIYQGDVWKDVLFANATLAGFAALAWTARCWSAPAARYALAALAVLLLALASLARQNGVIALACGAAGFAAIAARLAGRPERRLARAAGQGAAFLAGGLVIVALAASGLARRSDGEPAQAEQLAWLQAWDLAGAVHADPRFDLTELSRAAPAAARFVRRDAAPAWTAERQDTLVALPGGGAALQDAEPAIARQWLALILRRADLYVRVRVADVRQLLAPSRPLACRPLFVGVDGPPEMMKTLGLAQRRRAKDDFARHYGLAFVGTPVLSHLAYAVLALALLAWAAFDLRDPRAPADRIAVVALLAGALVFAASFLVMGVACDYRYLYLLDLSAMAGLLHRAGVRPSVAPD